MSIEYTPIANGLFVDLKGRLGSIQATIDSHVRPKHWRLCFATCIGEAFPLQGRVRDFMSLSAVKHELERYDRELNAPYGDPIPGFRGMPLNAR